LAEIFTGAWQRKVAHTNSPGFAGQAVLKKFKKNQEDN
jgi:hypothetical protein